MAGNILEASYPISFRQKDSEELGEHLKHRHNVVLAGMKRVGISNFLRFFLYHDEIVTTYINDGKNHLFIPVDLNDLVERELYPFWVLTLKRIYDAVENYPQGESLKKRIETLFLDSIQSQDLFLTIDAIRKSLALLVDENIVPTIFYLRFDRMKSVVTPEFFSNLQGLIDASAHNLCFVITSERSLESLSPTVFTRASVSVFARTHYIKPSTKSDAEVIFDTLAKRYRLVFGKPQKQEVLNFVDGYTQYLQFALAYLNEKKKEKDNGSLFESLLTDERIALQSEELWESLTPDERDVLVNVLKSKKVNEDERDRASYLWNTGILNNLGAIFSPLFQNYVENARTKLKTNDAVEFSKKEHLLLTLLEENKGALCEREQIIESVWPEVEDYGVSDWAVDRLVARLRGKLKILESPYEIVTVKTRGYKLV